MIRNIAKLKLFDRIMEIKINKFEHLLKDERD